MQGDENSRKRTAFILAELSEVAAGREIGDLRHADEVRQSRSSREKCKYPGKTPILAIWHGRAVDVVQADCGMWDCPRCGPRLARQWYGKLVYGASELARLGKELSFITLTCRGSELSLAEAEQTYYQSTNRVLSTLRARAKKNGDKLIYAQITERQARGHPHSHMIATGVHLNAQTCLREDCPGGSEPGHVSGRGKGVCGFNSDLSSLCSRAGLGVQARITPIQNAIGATKYVAKYLFKASMFLEEWPKSWHRIRVSGSWPRQEKEQLRIDIINKPADVESLNGYQTASMAESGKMSFQAVKPALVTCADDILREMINRRLLPGEEFKPAFAIDPRTGKAVFVAYLDHDDNVYCDE